MIGIDYYDAYLHHPIQLHEVDQTMSNRCLYIAFGLLSVSFGFGSRNFNSHNLRIFALWEACHECMMPSVHFVHLTHLPVTLHTHSLHKWF